MSVPFYVSPEQLVHDRAEYARKGIARGRSVLALSCRDGVLFVAENPSRTLRKVSEIYDRIGFAAVGKYTEFEHLRVAGIRYADLRGYSYDRSDVSARGLANAYAQTLGTVFTTESKPYEVEIAVAQVGSDPGDDQLFRLTYDGSVSDEPAHIAMGGAAEALTRALAERHDPLAPGYEALPLAVELLGGLGATELEVALLDRSRQRRTFRRIVAGELERMLRGEPGDEAATDQREG